jgi:heme-degrading monooxygenase HmoA
VFARSMAWSGGGAALDHLGRRLADDVAPACREIPGHGWITAVRMDGEDAVTVTSFWESEEDAAPGGVGEQRLSVLGEVDGCALVSSSRYDVRVVRREGPTLPGFVVSAASFPYDARREQEAVHWAAGVTEAAGSRPGFNFSVVELAEGPRVISVTTWQDRHAFAAAEVDLRAAYERAPGGVDATDRQWRRGSVVFSSSDGAAA